MRYWFISGFSEFLSDTTRFTKNVKSSFRKGSLDLVVCYQNEEEIRNDRNSEVCENRISRRN